MQTLSGLLSDKIGINAVVKAESFPVHIRALGVGLPYAMKDTKHHSKMED